MAQRPNFIYPGGSPLMHPTLKLGASEMYGFFVKGDAVKLQATVEGLSVAAITYYIVGLVSYLAKGAHGIGWPWSAESSAAVAIPVVALGVWWSLRRLHSRVFKD